MGISPISIAPAGALIFILVLIACGGSSGATPEVSTGCDPRYIPAAEAAQHIGEEATVCGLVKDYFFSTTGSKPTFILFERSGAARVITGRGLDSAELNITFTVLILGKDKSSFPANFGSFYTGKMICATGLRRVRRGCAKLGLRSLVRLGARRAIRPTECASRKYAWRVHD